LLYVESANNYGYRDAGIVIADAAEENVNPGFAINLFANTADQQLNVFAKGVDRKS
jgi:hypothetical protein